MSNLTDELVARCRELKELATAGESKQEALSRLAATYRADIPSHDRRAMARNQTHHEAMRFVLAAASAQAAVPNGYKLVPVEPTPEMIAAARAFDEKRGYFSHPDVPYHGTAKGDDEHAWGDRMCAAYYRTMIAAAPVTPASDSDVRQADASIVRAGLIGLSKHVKSVPAYSKLLGDMEVVDKAIELLASQLPRCASDSDVRRKALEEAAIRASVHSQYPVTTDYDRGYAKARDDAARAIRALLREAGSR